MSTAELNRLRLTELHRALLSELDELDGNLERVFQSIRQETRAQAAELKKNLEATIAGLRSFDDPWALHLSAQIEKLAHRLVVFRSETRPDAEDLAAISTRLAKASRKLRH